MSKTKILLLAAIALIAVGGLGGWVVWSSADQRTDVSAEKMLNKIFNDIVIHTDKAWLDIRPTEEETTTIKLAGQIHKSASCSFDAEVVNGVLTISVIESSGSPLDFMLPTHLNVIISLPEKQYDSLQLDVEGNHGEVHIERLEIDEIDCKTNSSGIALQTITSKSITMETTSAPITLTDVTSDTITTKTYSAETWLKNVEAHAITTRAVSGRIVLSTSHIDRQIDMETSSGEILLQASQQPENVRFDVSNGSGTVNILEGRYIGGNKIGDGENKVRLATKSGSIDVEAK